MVDLRTANFDTWTIDEGRAADEGEPIDVMPCSGREVPGSGRKRLNGADEG